MRKFARRLDASAVKGEDLTQWTGCARGSRVNAEEQVITWDDLKTAMPSIFATPFAACLE